MKKGTAKLGSLPQGYVPFSRGDKILSLTASTIDRMPWIVESFNGMEYHVSDGAARRSTVKWYNAQAYTVTAHVALVARFYRRSMAQHRQDYQLAHAAGVSKEALVAINHRYIKLAEEIRNVLAANGLALSAFNGLSTECEL